MVDHGGGARFIFTSLYELQSHDARCVRYNHYEIGVLRRVSVAVDACIKSEQLGGAKHSYQEPTLPLAAPNHEASSREADHLPTHLNFCRVASL